MSYESAIAFFIAIFIFGITPGPGCFALIAKSFNQGLKALFFISNRFILG